MSKAAVWTRMKLKLWGGTSWQQNRAMQERNAFWDFHVSKAMVWMRIKLKRWGGTSWQQNRAMEERICILIAMYSQGLGVDQDKGEAVKWCKLAAERGYRKAQSSLGAIYEQPIILSPHPQTLASSSWKPSKLCQEQLEDLLEIFTGYFIGSLLWF